MIEEFRKMGEIGRLILIIEVNWRSLNGWEEEGINSKYEVMRMIGLFIGIYEIGRWRVGIMTWVTIRYSGMERRREEFNGELKMIRNKGIIKYIYSA